MSYYVPSWAFEKATPEMRKSVQTAQDQGNMVIEWPEKKALRFWSKQQGWPAPRFSFEGSFIKKMLESDENFAKALDETGIVVVVPTEQHTLSDEELQELDESYKERDSSGHPTSWGGLVEELRGMRRAVEMGVVLLIEGNKLKEAGSFYTWAHGRYSLLEDGYDSWIGDDNS
ncbi:MAG TPA: hypothetical protein VFI27_18505 [candidate division Zixibacteria bacterium]|nr:hypothetical protein [candidate division Zixibacteria bacterium]